MRPRNISVLHIGSVSRPRVRAAAPLVFAIILMLWGVPADLRSAPRVSGDGGPTSIVRDDVNGPWFMKSWGSSITGDGKFSFPNGVAID